MGFFDKLFEKKECNICGGEIGVLGNRKLEDGNCCKQCAKKLSPWFEERRHSTIAEIQEQLAYREQNSNNLKGFTVTRAIGDSYKMYIEEINGIPTRFFVTNKKEYKEENPDIIPFDNVISCISDIDVRDTEKKRKNENGQMVSYNPPRFEQRYDFYIEMEIRSPYFDKIRFRINSNTVTLESVGNARGRMSGYYRNGSELNLGSDREHRLYQEYTAMCDKICQMVEDGKRGAATASVQRQAAVSPESTGPKFCQNCGSPAVSGKFCQYCGSSLVP